MKKSAISMNSPPKPFEERYFPKTISGGLIDGHDVVGYCHYSGHQGYLLNKHLKEHDCLQKECHYLEKNNASRYFMNLDFLKNKRKISKKLKRLWDAGIMPANVYMMCDNLLRDISSQKELDNFYEKQIQITVDVKSLLTIDFMNGE